MHFEYFSLPKNLLRNWINTRACALRVGDIMPPTWSAKSKGGLIFSKLKMLLFVLRSMWHARWVPIPAGRFPIIIMDTTGAAEIQRILGNLNHLILPLRGEHLFINREIAIKTIFNLKRLRNPMAAYALAVVEHVRPKLIITLIDNSAIYHNITRLYSDAAFLAIQNGMRCLERDNAQITPVHHDHFVCFGVAHEEAYRRFGASVNYYHPFGSVRDAVYRELFPEPGNIKYDLCLISEVEQSLFQLYPLLWGGVDLLSRHLSRYCKETKRSVVIAMRSDPREDLDGFQFENKYFSEIFEDTEFKLIPNATGEYSSYLAVDSSRVAMSVFSTLGLEAFGRNRRVLFYNPTGERDYDLPEMGVWSFNSPEYYEFKNRLDKLLAMSDEDYMEMQQLAAGRMMAVMTTPLLKGPLRTLILSLADYH